MLSATIFRVRDGSKRRTPQSKLIRVFSTQCGESKIRVVGEVTLEARLLTKDNTRQCGSLVLGSVVRSELYVSLNNISERKHSTNGTTEDEELEVSKTTLVEILKKAQANSKGLEDSAFSSNVVSGRSRRLELGISCNISSSSCRVS